MSIVPANQKVPAGVLAIFLGQLGIHKFIIGAPNAGIATLAASVLGWALAPFTCGVSAIVPAILHIIGVVEGVIYLTRTDGEFYSTYTIGRKSWF